MNDTGQTALTNQADFHKAHNTTQYLGNTWNHTHAQQFLIFGWFIPVHRGILLLQNSTPTWRG